MADEECTTTTSRRPAGASLATSDLGFATLEPRASTARPSGLVRPEPATGDVEVVRHHLTQRDRVDADSHDSRTLSGVAGGVLAVVGVYTDGHASGPGPGDDRGQDAAQIPPAIGAVEVQGQRESPGADVDPVKPRHAQDGVEVVECGRGLHHDDHQRLIGSAGEPPDRPSSAWGVTAGGGTLPRRVGVPHPRPNDPPRTHGPMTPQAPRPSGRPTAANSGLRAGTSGTEPAAVIAAATPGRSASVT